MLCNSLAAGNESVNYIEVCEAAFPMQLCVRDAHSTWGCRYACLTGSSHKKLGSWMLQQLGRLYWMPMERGSPAAGGQGLLHLEKPNRQCWPSLPAPAETSSEINSLQRDGILSQTTGIPPTFSPANVFTCYDWRLNAC